MNKKSAKSKLSISFIGILLAALSLCFLAFTSANAVSDEPEPEIPDVQQGNIRLDVQRPDLGAIQYQLNGMWSDLNSTKELTSTDMAGQNEIYLKLAPNSHAIDKQLTIVHDGNSFVSLNEQSYTELLQGTYKLTYNPNAQKGQYAKLAILETRSVSVTLTDDSKQMLTQNFTLILGHGDKNDVKVTQPESTNNVRIDKGTEQRLIISFAIKSDTYFIPYITVNNVKYQTIDTGMHDEDDHVIICSTLEGSAASVSSFKVDLSIFAQPTCTSDSSSMEIVQDATSYEYMLEGQVVNAGTFALNGSDTQIDSQVENAIATYDLKLTKDGSPASVISGGMDMHLLLSTSTYSEQDYKVVRNHDGVVEELDTTCEVVKDRETGEVKGIDVGFNSDKFSNYSIVPANVQPVTPEESTTAQTGDSTPIIPIAVAVLCAFGLVVLSLKKFNAFN